MLTIKNGLKSVLRTPWKTALFSAVLILLSALLTVSLCVFSAVRSYLSDCDDYYHTIADLQYIGSEYPRSSFYDEALEQAVAQHRDELDALLRAPSVLSYEAESNHVALIEGMHRTDGNVLEPNRAIMRLKNIMYDDRLDVFLMEVVESCYSCYDYTGTMLFVRKADMPCDGGEKLENGKTYYTVGRFFKGQTENPWFFAESASYYEGEQLVTVPPFTPDDAEEAGEDYLRLASNVQKNNNSLRVFYSAALEDYPPFQQQTIAMTKGRLFTEQEYNTRARVCIVSERTAGAFELDVGDRIPLQVFSSARALYEPGKWELVDESEYEIVGLYRDSEEHTYQVFLPDASVDKIGIRPVTGYRLGHFRLQNDQAADFAELAQPLQDYGFRVSIYDQGYGAATEPMRELLFLSLVFLFVCLMLALAAHAMQSHLFVSRQKETALTMRALGTNRVPVVLYFLAAALFLAICSAVPGALIGKLLERRVLGALAQFATQFADEDLRFSGSRLSLSRNLAFEPVIPFSVYLLSAALLVLGSVLFTASFALGCLQESAHKPGRRLLALQVFPKRARKSSRLSNVLKYALLSIRRGAIRTLAVILLCSIVAVFFGRLTTSLDGYRAQLEAYREHAVITGFATDYRGQLIDGLTVRYWPVKQLLETGLISDYTLTDTVAYCEPVGVSKSADGTEHELPQTRIPAIGSFAMETLIDRLQATSRWVAASTVNGSPIFHYEKNQNIQWLDGYSDADFAGKAKICALPKHMMEEHGIELGDTVRFLFYAPFYFSVEAFGTVDVLVVGAYNADTSKSNVLSPISFLPFIAAKEEQGESYADFDANNITTRTYDSFRFTLRSANDLQEVRQALARSGFTWVQTGDRAHPFAIVEDEIYLNTTHSMERQIQYVGVLYDALYAIAGIIGFALAWLLTASRRKEIALMRAMGTRRRWIRWNFSFEQAVLSTLGIGLGVMLSRLTGSGFSTMFLLLCGAFWLLWNASTLLCVVTGLTKASFVSLTEPE